MTLATEMAEAFRPFANQLAAVTLLTITLAQSLLRVDPALRPLLLSVLDRGTGPAQPEAAAQPNEAQWLELRKLLEQVLKPTGGSH